MSQTAPAAHFNLFLLRNFLDAETCAKLRTELTEAPTTQAPVYIQGTEGLVHETVRKTTSVHPADETFTDVHERLLQQLPALEQHGRLQLGQADRDRVLAISGATIDRLLVDVKIAASGGRRRRAGFYSAIRREVPIRTFNDWNSPLPGFCEVDMVAHGGTSVAGSFIQTLTMVDVATGWTECLPLLTREATFA